MRRDDRSQPLRFAFCRRGYPPLFFFREKATESGGAAGNEEGADLKKLGEKRRKNKTPTAKAEGEILVLQKLT